MQALPKLNVLHISGLPALPPALSALPALTELTLGAISGSTLAVATLAGMSRLRRLTLCGGLCVGTWPADLAALTYLDLSYCEGDLAVPGSYAPKPPTFAPLVALRSLALPVRKHGQVLAYVSLRHEGGSVPACTCSRAGLVNLPAGVLWVYEARPWPAQCLAIAAPAMLMRSGGDAQGGCAGASSEPIGHCTRCC